MLIRSNILQSWSIWSCNQKGGFAQGLFLSISNQFDQSVSFCFFKFYIIFTRIIDEIPVLVSDINQLQKTNC